MSQLGDYVDYEVGEELAAKLTHICAVDDFFEMFKGDHEATYKYDVEKLETHLHRNEVRVRLAMEAGIHPLFVDCSNLKLWEMRPYISLAERLGYVTSIVDRSDICEKSDDLEFLVAANDTQERRHLGKVVTRGMIAAMIKAFEPMPPGVDPVEAIRNAERPIGSRVLEALNVPEPKPGKAFGVPPPFGKGVGRSPAGGQPGNAGQLPRSVAPRQQQPQQWSNEGKGKTEKRPAQDGGQQGNWQKMPRYSSAPKAAAGGTPSSAKGKGGCKGGWKNYY